MKISMMSLDTSSTASGWCYWEDGQNIRNDVIDLKKSKDDKHQAMTKELWALLNDYNPDIVVLEETSVLTNAVTQRVLTQITGTVYTWCAINKKEYHSLRPSEWRKLSKSNPKESLPKKREELKAWSVQRVKDLYGIETSDDGSDAILIGRAYLKMFEN